MVNVSAFGSKPADKMKREINIRYPQSPYAVYSLMLGVYKSMRINNLHFPAYRQIDQVIHSATNKISPAPLEIPKGVIEEFNAWWHGDANGQTPSDIPAGKYLAPVKSIHEQTLTVGIRKPVLVMQAWADYIHDGDWSYVCQVLNIDPYYDAQNLHDLATKDIPHSVWNRWELEVRDVLDEPCTLIEAFVATAIFEKSGLHISTIEYETPDESGGIATEVDPYANLRP